MYNLLTNTLFSNDAFTYSTLEVLILKAICCFLVFSIAPTLIKYALVKSITPEKEVVKEPKYVYQMNWFEFKKAKKEFDKQQAQDEIYNNFRRKYDGFLGKYFTDYAYRYCQRPYVFGYLGHELRTKNTDILLTTVVSNAKTKYSDEDKIQLFSMWLCSKEARHFMDQFENLNEVQFVKQAKEKLPLWLASMEQFYYEPTQSAKKEVK